jgi:hypothetical protein
MSETLSWDLIVRDHGSASVAKFRKELEGASKDADKSKGSWSGLGEGLTKVATGWIQASSKIGIGSVALVKSAGAIQGVVGALGALSGVVGLIPGAFAQLGVIGATVKVGMAGVSDAFTASAKGGKEYKQALDNLAPSQQKFVKSVVAQKSAWTEARKAVGQDLFANLSKEVKPLAETYLPMVEQGLGFVARGLNGAITALAEWAQTPKVVGVLTNVLMSAGRSAQNLGELFVNIGDIVIDVIGASTKSVGTMGGGIVDLSYKVDDFMNKFTAGGTGGDFTKWVDRGKAALKQMGVIIGGVGHIIANVFSASGAHATSPLGNMAADMQKLAVASDKPAFKTGITKIFDAISKSAGSTQRYLPLVVQAIEKLAPAFENVIASGGGSFGTTIKIIAQTLITLAPVINAVTAALIPLAPILGILSPVLFLVSKGIQAIMAAQKAAEAIKAMAVAMKALNLAFLTNPIFLVIVAIVALIAIFVVAYKQSETFRNIVNGALHGVETVAKAVWTAIRVSALAVWHAIEAVVKSVVSTIKIQIKASEVIVKGVWTAIKTTASIAFKAIVVLVKADVAIIKAVFVTLPNAIKAVVNKVKALFTAKTLANAGKLLIQGLTAGIKAAASGPVNAVKSVVSKVKKLLPGSPIQEGPLKSWNNGGAGKRLMSLLTTGINAGAPGAANAMSKALTGLGSPSGFVSGGYGASPTMAAAGGGGNVIHLHVTQPLGTPTQLVNAMADAFTAAPAGSKKLPKGSVKS